MNNLSFWIGVPKKDPPELGHSVWEEVEVGVGSFESPCRVNRYERLELVQLSTVTLLPNSKTESQDPRSGITEPVQ